MKNLFIAAIMVAFSSMAFAQGGTAAPAAPAHNETTVAPKKDEAPAAAMTDAKPKVNKKTAKKKNH